MPIIAGVWMYGESSAPPASSSKTLACGSADSRLARTQPAEPAPTIMKSNIITFRHLKAGWVEQMPGSVGEGGAKNQPRNSADNSIPPEKIFQIFCWNFFLIR